MSIRIHIVMPDELVATIDAALAPGQPRADFIRRAVVQALEQWAKRSGGPYDSHPEVVAAIRRAIEQRLDQAGFEAIANATPDDAAYHAALKARLALDAQGRAVPQPHPEENR